MTAAEHAHTLLLVDDDERLRPRLARALRDRGLLVTEARSTEEAIAWLDAEGGESPEYAVVDLRMEGASGLTLVEALHARDETTRVVVLTGYGSIATAVDAMRRGAFDYLQKPADADQVLAALEGRGKVTDAETPSLARVEWEHIQRVLHDVDGNVSLAAKALGLHRRSLQRKLGKDPVRR